MRRPGRKSVAIFLLLLLGAARDARSQGAPAAPTFGGDYLDVGGSKIYYEQCGSGPPVVLLHDGLLHSVTWDDSWSALCKRFRAVRYDRRGYGRSDLPLSRFSPVEDLYALVAQLNVPRAVVVGNSSRSALTIDFALAYPEMVKALLLVGPVVHGMGVTDHFRERGRSNSAPLEKGDVPAAAANWSKDPYILASGHEAARKKLRDGLARNPQNLRSGLSGDPELTARRGEVVEFTWDGAGKVTRAIIYEKSGTTKAPRL